MFQNLGIDVKDDFIQDLVKQASQSGSKNATKIPDRFSRTSRRSPGSGLMNEAEFLQWISRIQNLRSDDDEDDVTKDLVAAFRVFDRDSNGYITKDELRSAMDMIGESVTDQQLTELLTLADVDKDGRINYEGIINGKG